MTRQGKLFAVALLSLTMVLGAGAAPPTAFAVGQPQTDVFEQVRRTVAERFFDPDLNGVDWQALAKKYAPLAAAAPTREEKAAVINAMLGELKTSHTRLFTPDEPAYYQMLGVFLPRNDSLGRRLKAVGAESEPHYSGIGIFTRKIDGETFVSAVLDGGPAAKAGLLAGDRLIEADGKPFHATRSFAGKANQPVKLLVQRSPDPASRMEITVSPKTFDGRTMFLDAMKASIQVIERDGRRIGYVHVWSYAGEQYQEMLERALLYGRLKDADALILDVREGWGGASPEYLNIFTPRAISMTTQGRNRGPYTFRSGWSKPVVLLVNENTRSGKELLAYGFRRHGIGPVVGSKTAGAVVAGTLYVMDDGSLLYLAVSDVHVDGDVRLEGVGVTPDIEVPSALAYAQGADPQKDRAIAVALDLVKG